MTFVKFCGMTREEDVDAAVELGVDAVGFVLWPESPRAVPRGTLRTLAGRVPATVLPVGVFVRPSQAEIEQACEQGMRAVQIHGMTAAPLWPIPAVLWMAASLSGDAVSPDVPDEVLLVLDAHDPKRHGGTGRTIDWQRAGVVAARRRLLLAGGLTPANVEEAIRVVRPYGVDVASGIESRPGVKDRSAMSEFIRRVRQAASS
jgi:phosphoribosylanthranilate isomerase